MLPSSSEITDRMGNNTKESFAGVSELLRNSDTYLTKFYKNGAYRSPGTGTAHRRLRRTQERETD